MSNYEHLAITYHLTYISFSSVQFSSVTQSCLTLVTPWITQCRPPCPSPTPRIHSDSHHRVSDAIQPSHPLSSPSPPAPNPSQIRVFSNESTLHMRWPKYWSFSFSIILFKEHPGLISFRMDWLDLLQSKGLSRALSKTTVQQHQFFDSQLSSQSNSRIHTWPL